MERELRCDTSCVAASGAVQHGVLPEIEAAHQAVRKWADALGIGDAWFLDAAVQSMRAWGLGGIIGKWLYFAGALETKQFQLSFGSWIPYFSEWPEFKRHADTVYRRELKQYRSDISK